MNVNDRNIAHLVNKKMLGGAERIAAEISNELNHRIYTLLTIRKEHKSFSDKEEDLIVLLKSLLKGNISILHSHNYQSHVVSWILYFTYNKSLKLLFKRGKLELVWTIHFDPGRLGLLKVGLLKFFQFLSPSTIVFVSNTIAKKWGSSIGKQVTIYNGSKFVTKDYSSRKNGIVQHCKVALGIIARDVPDKRLSWFLELARAHQDQVKPKFDFSFHIMSDISVQSAIRSGLNNDTQFISAKVHLYPPTYALELFMGSVDVILSFSKYESFGLVGLEALSFNKRFYALPLDVYNELFQERDILIDADTPMEFYTRLNIALSRSYPGINLEMFSFDRMLKSYQELYGTIDKRN